MKFKVTAKDFVIFIIFCVFLFFLCSITVVNFSSFSKDGTFVGINPFLAWTKEYFPATIALFAVLLIVIFTSVSSYIFSKEKGKGVGIKLGDKEEKGYSRWAKEKEIKTAPKVEKVLISQDTANAAGVALMNNGKEMYVDNGENHTLVIGATASGKTTAVVDPLVYSLAKKGESMVVTDPKGEIYKNHAALLRDKGYNVIVLNFRDPVLGSAWNPLSLPYKLYKEGNVDKATELLDDVALNILIDPKNPGDPFWERNASDYFSGIALGLFEDAKDEKQVNLNSIGFMATAGEERFAASDYMKEYFNLKGEESSAYVFASSVINAPSETKGGVVSVFRQKIRLFTSRKNLSEMLSHSDFDMRKIGAEKTAVFMIIHDEKTTYHALATIFIKQCYETLIDVAYKQPDGRLPYRTNFILDEFANMPALKDVTSMVTAARSRDVRFVFIIQNFAQLNDVYGEHDAQTIRSNCGNLIYLITTELAALEEISKLCGEVKSKEKDKTASTPLVSVSDLQKMKMNEVIIIRARLNPFKTKLTPSYEIDWGKKYEKSEFTTREEVQVELFDLKEYVKEQKRGKLFDNLNSTGKPTGPLPTNPFMGNNDGKSNKFNFDELAKKIDARIAELEAEEKAKAQKAKTEMPALATSPKEEPKVAVSPVINTTENIVKPAEVVNDNQNRPPEITPKPEFIQPNPIINNETPNIMSKPDLNATPNVHVDTDSVIVSENNITDDEFFDDFFQDDD